MLPEPRLAQLTGVFCARKQEHEDDEFETQSAQANAADPLYLAYLVYLVYLRRLRRKQGRSRVRLSSIYLEGRSTEPSGFKSPG